LISRNVVFDGNKYYVQAHGIAQGSLVSPLLCNLIYADMERGWNSVPQTSQFIRSTVRRNLKNKLNQNKNKTKQSETKTIGS